MDAGGGTGGTCLEKRNPQPANPTAMQSLLLSPHCKYEGESAFEVLACLAGKDPKIAQKDSCGSQKLLIFYFYVWGTRRVSVFMYVCGG